MILVATMVLVRFAPIVLTLVGDRSMVLTRTQHKFLQSFIVVAFVIINVIVVVIVSAAVLHHVGVFIAIGTSIVRTDDDRVEAEILQFPLVDGQ